MEPARPELPGLPARYVLERQLGRGGGGQVWSAVDAGTGEPVAVKVLHLGSSGAEVDALIREATALSGLEGLGFPRVLRFGRLADGRLFLVREMVFGRSLEKVGDEEPERFFGLLCLVADALTVVHRAGLLHGDVKPANVIVRPSGGVSLVDLGLATALSERGEASSGLTPHYAAPEVRAGGPLTPQAEVYSLGVMLEDALADAPEGAPAVAISALKAITERALDPEPSRRFPSTDEFGQALRLALGGDVPSVDEAVEPWPVLDLEGTAYQLRRAVDALPPGARLVVVGPKGAGITTLLRRLSWGLSVDGSDVGFVEAELRDPTLRSAEIGRARGPGSLLVVDQDAEPLEEELRAALARGARVVLGATRQPSESHGFDPEMTVFRVPSLSEPAVRRLLSLALPGLPEHLVPLLVERTGGRPGALRSFVELAASEPIVSAGDLDELLRGVDVGGGDPRTLLEASLDRGHYGRARTYLDRLPGDDAHSLWLRARYELAAGSAEAAVEFASRALEQAPAQGLEQRIFATLGRAELGAGRYQAALDRLARLDDFAPAARSEALSYRGLAETLLGRHDDALATLRSASEVAESLESDRLLALSSSARATAEWRAGRTSDAISSYREAVRQASRSGDAGMLSSALINLAGLLKERGELAESVRMLESAVAAARRAGRLASVQQALLNLGNLDLYLGRVERARAGLGYAGDPKNLPPALAAQHHGLRAELLARSGQIEEALAAYEACELAWDKLGRGRDAGEAALEAALLLGSIPTDRARPSGTFVPSFEALTTLLERGRRHLADAPTALLRLAEARASFVGGDVALAEEKLDLAEELSTAQSQREWLWRTHALRAELADAAGKHTRASQAREAAVLVLEEIGASLPEDLRSVFWSDPRRAELRPLPYRPISAPPHTSPGAFDKSAFAVAGRTPKKFVTRSGSDALSRMSQTPLERRLTRILAVNADLAAEVDLSRLTEKIVAHAAELLDAERGFLLLGETALELTVFARRGGQGTEHEDFSRSIAGQVLSSGEPLVSIDAERDQRLAGFESVHAGSIKAVACVPIRAPSGRSIGALYLESRAGVRPDFGGELPTLQAFADQAAIALESARLVGALEEKTRALAEQNERLEEAKLRLRQVLDRRTERLKEVRRELKETRSQISTHAAYAGLVGASPAMRRVYSLIERIKDTDVPVLVTGESGTGKEVVARAIFQGSVRSSAKMLAVNCGAIPESILESELFGHVRGAFTGADRDRRGLFREADGGMLFLDEIGETPIKMQASLLRVLQEGKVRPVGGSEEVSIDVRVVFATNRDLEEAVRQGRFREDLLYRIRVVEIHLPPLRERREDLPLLVDHFLDRMAVRFGQPKKSLSRDALQRILEHPLPGNVRQLENVLLNAWVLSEGERIEAEDVELSVSGKGPSVPPSASRREFAAVEGEVAVGVGASAPQRVVSAGEPGRARRGTRSEHERGQRAQIVWALEQTGWNRVKAAELIGMPRRTFYRRLKDFGLQ